MEIYFQKTRPIVALSPTLHNGPVRRLYGKPFANVLIMPWWALTWTNLSPSTTVSTVYCHYCRNDWRLNGRTEKKLWFYVHFTDTSKIFCDIDNKGKGWSMEILIFSTLQLKSVDHDHESTDVSKAKIIFCILCCCNSEDWPSIYIIWAKTCNTIESFQKWRQ